MLLDPIAAIFEHYGIRSPWQPLPATGEVNRIYATRDVVLRVATDHPEAVADARTESVAAPVAHTAGILTPRLLVFDDSRELVDRPFSLWERVHGETFGLIRTGMPDTWQQVGRQIASLHSQVSCCPDPNGYLERLERDLDLDAVLRQRVDAGRVDSTTAREAERLIRDLRPYVERPANKRFLHGDLHDMNIMCRRDGRLLALIDWGDAGWADPTLEFPLVPLAAIPFVIQGYESEAPGQLGDVPEARIVWDKILGAVDPAVEGSAQSLALYQLRAFLHAGLR